MSDPTGLADPRHLDDEQLSSLVDGRLAPDDRAGAEAHLAGCAGCRAALDGLRDTVALLRALPQAEPPRSFLLAETARPPLALRLAPWTRAVGGLAAALFVILVSAELLGGMGAPPAAPRAAEPAVLKATESSRPAPAPTSTAAPPKPAAPAAKAAAPAVANQDRAAEGGKAADAAAPSGPAPPAAPALAPAAPAGQAAPAQRAAESARAAAPASSPAAPAARPAAPVEVRPVDPGPSAVAPEPGYLASVPTPAAAPRSASSAGASWSSALRPWQVASGVLALLLLAASVLLPRLAGRAR